MTTSRRPQPRAGVREQRVFPLAQVEVRDATEADPLARVIGHAAVYNTWSQDLGGFKERVLPGAFDKSIGVSDVRALFNHDPNYIFARSIVPPGAEGSLSLATEQKGLHIEARPLNTAPIRDLVLAPMRAGLVTQMSFSFLVREGGDVWREPKSGAGLWERDLTDLELFDVSPVTFPAYSQTDVAVRAILEGAGFDFGALSLLLLRADRGLPITAADLDLINGSVAFLRSLTAGSATPEEGAGAGKPEDGSPGAAGTGASRARLLRDLDHRLRLDGARMT